VTTVKDDLNVNVQVTIRVAAPRPRRKRQRQLNEMATDIAIALAQDLLAGAKAAGESQ
jgi:hypothetical protein